MAEGLELIFEFVPHSPSSPDLALLDLFPFTNLKLWIAVQKFSSNEEVMVTVREYFAECDRTCFFYGMKKLDDPLASCISLKGDYVQK